MEERYIFVVPQKAMIMKGRKYLVLKRSPDAHTYPNRWDFPGGRLEIGEDVLKSLEREVLEETSLKMRARNPVFTFHEILNDHAVVFIIYSCRVVSGEVMLSDEHTEFRWATREEILKLEIENYLRAFLKSAFYTGN